MTEDEKIKFLMDISPELERIVARHELDTLLTLPDGSPNFPKIKQLKDDLAWLIQVISTLSEEK